MPTKLYAKTLHPYAPTASWLPTPWCTSTACRHQKRPSHTKYRFSLKTNAFWSSTNHPSWPPCPAPATSRRLPPCACVGKPETTSYPPRTASTVSLPASSSLPRTAPYGAPTKRCLPSAASPRPTQPSRRLPTSPRHRLALPHGEDPGELQGRIVEGEVNAITEVAGVEPVDKAPYEAIHGALPELAKYTLKPQTGKTHQLRLHMLQAGAPIIGDPIYPVIYPAEAEDMRIPMHLTATHISFVDPLTGADREFSSQLPLQTYHLLNP